MVDHPLFSSKSRQKVKKTHLNLYPGTFWILQFWGSDKYKSINNCTSPLTHARPHTWPLVVVCIDWCMVWYWVIMKYVEWSNWRPLTWCLFIDWNAQLSKALIKGKTCIPVSHCWTMCDNVKDVTSGAMMNKENKDKPIY